VTSVFTAAIVWSSPDGGNVDAQHPFSQSDNVGALNFMSEVLNSEVGPNFVFTLNLYPYFDPNMKMDPDGKHCEESIKQCMCFNSTSYCKTLVNVARVRDQISALKQLRSSQGKGETPNRFWIGEVGWSAPQASTLGYPMKNCDDFSSMEVYQSYYENYLKWEMNLDKGYAPVDAAFYFSMRDSNNFGRKEYFGLMEDCKSSKCKLQAEDRREYVSLGV
jgi:hypothetical protein